MTPTRPSPARRPQGGVPAAGWTLFGPHTPNSVARAGERAVVGRARAAKTRATILLIATFLIGWCLPGPAMRPGFFIPG